MDMPAAVPKSSLSRPLTVWAVSDGRAGIENQALGLAEAIARQTPAEITVKRVHYAPLFDRWPTALKVLPDSMLAGDSDRIAAPYPDIWIAAGRASLPFSLRMRKRSHGDTFVVQLQDPKTDLKTFDLVIAPEHDGLVAPNVLPLLGSTNRITRDMLAADYMKWRQQLTQLKGPHIAVLIGGKSRAYDLSLDRAAALALQVKLAVAEVNGSMLLTLSRRTPEPARAVIKDVLKDTPGILYDGEGDNPYFAFLHAADHILVTEDSVNMTTEAAATGKPLHMLALDRLKEGGKFETFHRALRMHGIAKPFSGHLEHWSYVPLDETARAARHLLQLYAEKRDPLRVTA
ncbi:mitochondrial fission ELM1 family protein [Asticcacaulis solisilvae]|uniref:mitochondrial fission ELM1 family protein n=1 Tax=Asticcacaulis solisilvae TaxID=1217274 RepID=UPI003FD71D2F